MKLPTDPAAYPEGWKPDPVTVKGPPVAPEVDALSIPECDFSDPAMLAAYYGPFGWSEGLRKIVLANVRESIRGHYILAGERVSESRLDDLAHRHGVYVEWFTRNLKGRHLYYMEERKRGLGG